MDVKELKDLLLARFDSIDSRLERIDEKAQRIEVETAKQEVTLNNQHLSLEEHIKRTELLENEVAHLNKQSNWVEGMFKLLGIITLIGSAATVVIKALS